MSEQPQAGDVWERDGMRCHILSVSPDFVLAQEVGRDDTFLRVVKPDWRMTTSTTRLIERNGKAVEA